MISNSDILFHCGTIGFGSLNLTDYIFVVHADDSLDGGTGVAIDNVFLGQHVGGRNNHSTQLVQSQHDNPPFVATF